MLLLWWWWCLWCCCLVVLWVIYISSRCRWNYWSYFFLCFVLFLLYCFIIVVLFLLYIYILQSKKLLLCSEIDLMISLISSFRYCCLFTTPIVFFKYMNDTRRERERTTKQRNTNPYLLGNVVYIYINK
jgi:hypothetical protein